MDARGTGVYLDPDYTDKFHSSDYNYLGIGPPSPKFFRRMPSPRSPIRHTAPADLGITFYGRPSVTSTFKPAVCRWEPWRQYGSSQSSSWPVQRPKQPDRAASYPTDGACFGRRGAQRLANRGARASGSHSARMEAGVFSMRQVNRRFQLAATQTLTVYASFRVLLLIFIIVTAVATCVVLTSSPYGP